MRRTRQRGPSNLAYGVIATVIIAIGTYLGFTKAIPFRHHYTVNAVFRSSNIIRKNAPVRIAGVNVGKVTGIKHLDGATSAAVVSMRMDDKGLPLHRDAVMTIRPRIFLEGNFFVDIKPGSPSAPKISDGDTIPINQTKTPVQLDQILTTLQTATRTDLKRLLRELGSGLAGSGARGYNRSIPYWQSAYKNSAIVNDATLGTLPHDLSGYIATAGATAEALDRNPAQLQSLITDFNTTANAFAVKQQALSSAIGELPRTLHAAMPAFASLNRAFPPVRNLVRALRPAVRSTGPAIDASLPFVRQLRGLVSASELRGLVKDLRPTVPSLARLQAETVPLYNQVRPASSCQNEVILPWSHDTIVDKTFPAAGPVFQESTKNLPGIAGESRSGDANGQWFRVLVGAGNYSYPAGADKFLITQEPLGGANPPKPAGRSPLRPDVPCETQQQPDLRTVPDQVAGEHKIANDTPAALARATKAESVAIDWLKASLKASPLDGVKGVTDNPVTSAIVPRLRELGK